MRLGDIMSNCRNTWAIIGQYRVADFMDMEECLALKGEGERRSALANYLYTRSDNFDLWFSLTCGDVVNGSLESEAGQNLGLMLKAPDWKPKDEHGLVDLYLGDAWELYQTLNDMLFSPLRNWDLEIYDWFLDYTIVAAGCELFPEDQW